jgi:hypothetical protein
MDKRTMLDNVMLIPSIRLETLYLLAHSSNFWGVLARGREFKETIYSKFELSTTPCWRTSITLTPHQCAWSPCYSSHAM